MKRWYNRKPETMQDWLLLFAVAAALLAAERAGISST